MSYISIKNWEKFQHYKNRNPPWIKLHRDLLRDYDFSCLQDASKLHLMLLWLLASQLDNKIPNDPVWIQKQVGLKTKLNLKDLLNKGFISFDSGVLAECKQDAIVETEAYKEETEKEKTIVEQKQLDRISEIIEYLNEKTGKKYQTRARASKTHISARIKEGYSFDDFRAAIDNQVAAWTGTDMEQYLRPSTLFNSEKFDGYVNNTASKSTSGMSLDEMKEKFGS